MPVAAYVQSAVFFILAAAALFGGAGTIAIPAFWIYLAILGAIFVASLFLLDPDLARERMRPGGQKPPLALQLFAFVLVAHWLIAGLDRGRFHWSDDVPLWLRVIGFIAVAGGYVLCLWAMRVNRFFSSVIRIQSDRGQHVIDSGPYAVVRHPGYLAGILVVFGSGLALCSWLAWAFLLVLSVPFLMYRVVVEDRVLHAELPGYRDYAARVRWRLVPGIW
ncbi:MAG TPA: isoprenylcysteine carboxylmethyltransferase family protein [Xanthobacteraceae bacterium]|jgi:protein-S-isoprenylcysteine O-methyltransferase Ste14|nr:isoprenylcysteine carboxylmethyltransferase family protein [Xanthobacteraceae bacterium]